MGRQLTLFVKSSNTSVREKRHAICHRVIEHFKLELPELKLLCFIDDEDSVTIKKKNGPANRGLHLVMELNECAAPAERIVFPDYVEELLREPKSNTNAYDIVIYVHGGTCEPDVSLIITFAHELQHVLQYGNSYTLWAVDRLFHRLKVPLGFTKWEDHPVEQDAIFRSKKVAMDLCGEIIVSDYANSQAISNEHVESERARWRYFCDLSISDQYDLGTTTDAIVQRHIKFIAYQAEGCPSLRSIDFTQKDWWKGRSNP